MGSYHPHGDTSIYDTVVRLAQPWAPRYTLVDGQGNFGSPGNDPAAAMRYTECRLAPIAMEMLRDIDKETVDPQPNHDGRRWRAAAEVRAEAGGRSRGRVAKVGPPPCPGGEDVVVSRETRSSGTGRFRLSLLRFT
ncbi:hypothetical protein Sme01_41720 [Sphaerisporangium melleum]|nr:hypothetical protein Sme01_41720 [Sphaerisporangium melleum]